MEYVCLTNRTPITGSSLLHVASYYGKVGMVKELVNVHGLSLVRSGSRQT